MSGAAQGVWPVTAKTGSCEQWCNTNQHDFLSDLPRPAATSLWEMENEAKGASMSGRRSE